MCTEVYRHQHIETGGNLFGLWTASGSAVIHVVPGPGKNCRRTTTSFHQDIEYMHRVGRFVNDNYMLCHIGEWHSHHSLSLNRPSTGDEQTVRRNFPQGVTKFLVIIANIRNTDTIVLSPYFFTDGGRRYEKAEYVVLNDDGPFSTDDKIVEQIQFGAEGSVDQRSKTTLAEKANNRRDSSHKTRNQLDAASKYELDGKNSSTCAQANQSSTPLGPNANGLSQVDAPKPDSTPNQSISNSQADRSPPRSQDIPSESTLRDSVGPMDADNTNHIPSEDDKDTSASFENTTSVPQTITPTGNQVHQDFKYDQSMSTSQADQNPSESQNIPGGSNPGYSVEPMDIGNTDFILSENSKDTSSSSKNTTSVSQTAAPAGNQGTPDSKDDQSISDSPASQSSSEFQDISSESTTGDTEEQMDTDDSDLILPQNDKETISSSESSPSVPQTVTLAGNQVDPNRNKNDDDETPSEREIVLKKIYDQLRNWFGTQSKSAFNFETSKNCPGAIEISFKHNNKYWLIRFPAEFPTIPAKLFHSTREASLRSRECSQSKIVESLINDVNILLTMKNICGGCSICKNFTKEMLSQPDYSSRFTEKFAFAINKIVTELTSTFADVTELRMNHPVDTSHATITFNHGTKWWIINVPVQFPDLPAKVYKQSDKESSQLSDVMFYESKSCGPRDLKTSKLIIKAINCNCFCSKCENMHGQYR